ncbi:COR domain-containing protein [Candidatus Leptofilum sp.]|uniref:COR domain-containing protein n=1 Tax=Candidatus Leptofilum sp. TaxID=3241576 RepID=UPI003B5C6081
MNEYKLAAIIDDAYRSKTRRLGLSGRGINSLPPEIGKLKYLEELNLNGNSLLSVPPEIENLQNLKILELNDNEITILPPEMGKLMNLASLRLMNNKLTKLPNEIGNISKLRELDIGNNQIEDIPTSIERLTNLTKFFLNNNKLTKLPNSISKLVNLQQLDLRNNNITEITPEIRMLFNLQALFLEGNSELRIPPEILKYAHQPDLIFRYYFQSLGEESLPLREAKMILVGDGRVGKTSIVRRLISNTFDVNEKITPGLAINSWFIPILKKSNEDQEIKIRLNVWDFGGQEIYHGTHQFFLTKRSLYLLVVDGTSKRSIARILYWLRLIESFGEDAPVIIVFNKSDKGSFWKNTRYFNKLRNEHPSIQSYIQTSCSKNTGINRLYKEIQKVVSRIPHIHDSVPSSWLSIKDRLESIQEREDFIPYQDYIRLCNTMGVLDSQDQKTLLAFLNDLGIILNFQDDRRLEDTSVLKPQWVTFGIYQILTSTFIRRNRGILNLLDLESILDTSKYPTHKHMFLLNIMRRFHLCIPFVDDPFLYLIPDLLPKSPPQYRWKYGPSLDFQILYDSLPSSILPRFIVRMHKYLLNNILWRNGIAIKHENAQAIISINSGNKVEISIVGDSRARINLLAIIRAEFRGINESFDKLQIEEAIPIPDFPEHSITYRELLVLEKHNINTFKHPQSGAIIYVDKILKGVEIPQARKLNDFLVTFKKSFNMNELKSMCFHLDIDFEELDASTFSRYAEELINYLNRRGRLGELVDLCIKKRPNINWHNLT